MRPADHEYKLMGLAAYNSEKYGKDAYNIFAENSSSKWTRFQLQKGG